MAKREYGPEAEEREGKGRMEGGEGGEKGTNTTWFGEGLVNLFHRELF